MSHLAVPAASADHPVSACRFCGTAMPDQGSGKTCGAPCCEARQLQEATRRRFQLDWDEHVAVQRRGIERAANGIAAAVCQLGHPPERLAFGVVPRQRGRLAPLPPVRRTAFMAHLEAIVAQAFASAGPEIDLDRRQLCECPEAPLLDATCATCRGLCCMLGGASHAFLTVEIIQIHRARNPRASASQIVEHYLSQLPEASVEHSCVYHGPHGCMLERRDRADVCNRYHCNPQADIARRFHEISAEAAVIVADDEDTEPAVAIFDAQGRHEVGSDSGVCAELVERTLTAAMAQVPALLAEEPPTSVPGGDKCLGRIDGDEKDRRFRKGK